MTSIADHIVVPMTICADFVNEADVGVKPLERGHYCDNSISWIFSSNSEAKEMFFRMSKNIEATLFPLRNNRFEVGVVFDLVRINPIQLYGN